MMPRKRVTFATLRLVLPISCLAGPALVTTLGVRSASASTIGPFPSCSNFDVIVDIEGGVQVNRTFVDKNGNTRVLGAGKGSDLTFTNASDHSKTFSLTGNGSVMQTTVFPDGSSSVVATGHNVILLFPTDDKGPSTKLYVGQVTYNSDAASNFTNVQNTGRTVDICAALA
jgi:hypothetical protein